MTESQAPDATQDQLAVRLLAIAVVLLIVVQILAQGYMPVDDALRHAGKGVSGRPWGEILVARPGLVDFSPGWHAFLGAVHRLTGANAHTLVWIEVVTGFMLISLPPLLLMRRPEAWLLAMTIGGVLAQQLVTRWVIGRPLLVSMAILVFMCLRWRRLDTERLSRPAWIAAALLVAAATWIHGSWYLWALPVAACVLARQFRVAIRFALASVAGVVFGALLTGHPVDFLWQNIALGLNLGGGAISAWVYEMQAYPFVPMLLIAVAAMVVIRKVWLDTPAATLARDPVFVLGAMACLLGFRSARFWMDWGMPAFVVFIALEIEALLIARTAERQRLLIAAGIALASFLTWTGNVNQRWVPRLERAFATIVMTRPAALPDSGGVLYTDDRRVFYEIFYLQPQAPWRYTLGFAPELMPPEDYAVYVNRQSTGTIESLEPWARKMKPEDRLLIRDPRGIALWNWMEWEQVEGGFYSGRRKR